MPVILLADEANKLTNPSLQKGAIETIIDKGASDYLRMLPFDSFAGSTYDFNIEKDLPEEDSAESPYGDDIAEGVGTKERIAVDVGMLARNADTPLVNDLGKSDINRQRAMDLGTAAKKMAKDFLRHSFNGTGLGVSLRGKEYWLRRYAGIVAADGTVTHDDADAPHFTDQKKFVTSDGTPGGTPQALSSKVFREFLNLSGDDKFDALLVDEDTYVDIQLLIEDMPGNMAQHVLDENFGRPILTFDGVKILKMYGAGDVLTASSITYTDATNILEAAETQNPKFLGFSDVHIGATVTITDGTDTYVGTVADIVAGNKRQIEVTWTSDPGQNKAPGDGFNLVVGKQLVCYGVRFDPLDGWTAYYHKNTGVPANPGDQYQGPIAGFNVTDIGRLQTGRRALRSQLDWFGNFAAKDPRSLARMSGYTRYGSGS